MQKIVNKITGFLDKNEVILTFSSNAYKPILDIWIEQISKLKIKNYCVVSLDKVIYSELIKRNVPTVLFDIHNNINSDNKSLLWAKRVELISSLLSNGIDVIHSDADAFWLKDIRYYTRTFNADLIFSVAYALPKNIVKHWGFILCCGFFIVKANIKNCQLFKDLLEKCLDVGDDQIAINQMLYEKGAIWWEDDDSLIHGFSPYYSVRINVLSKHIVSRQTQPADNICVYHPFLHSREVSLKEKQALTGLKEIRERRV